MLSPRQRKLVIAAALLVCLMFPVVLLTTSVLSPVVGYVCVLAVYWVFFCLPVSVVFGRGPDRVPVNLVKRPWWVSAVALALPVAVFFAAGPTTWLRADRTVLLLAVGCALINAPLEELAWRRSFRANSGSKLWFELLGLALFALWHVPLFFSRGIEFDHGFAGLVGGAFALGTVWVLLTRVSHSVGWPIVSHVLVNTAAFVPFFAANA
ncbi:MAG: CPBP family glutamic-type intramembrane protease [Pseudomonadota bacterium]